MVRQRPTFLTPSGKKSFSEVSFPKLFFPYLTWLTCFSYFLPLTLFVSRTCPKSKMKQYFRERTLIWTSPFLVVWKRGFSEAVVPRDMGWRTPKNQKQLVTVSGKVVSEHLSVPCKYLSIFWRYLTVTLDYQDFWNSQRNMVAHDLWVLNAVTIFLRFRVQFVSFKVGFLFTQNHLTKQFQ